MGKEILARIPMCAVFALLLFTSALAQPGFADEYQLSKGQTLYVSAYSNIFSAPKQVPFHLASILSIRNTDMAASITVASADYYDTKGKLIRKYYEKEVALGPLESTYVYISEEDTSGGFGANFIVRWKAAKEVNAPIVECLMIGMKSGQGISFVSPGRVIKEERK